MISVAAISRVLNAMVGITKGEDLPEPLPGNKEFYVTIDDEHLLCHKIHSKQQMAQ